MRRRVGRWGARVGIATLIVTSAAVASAGERYPLDDELRLDQVQMLATHNSYHLRPPAPFDRDPEADYAHAPLDTQLEDFGVRGFEIDTYNAPTLPVFHTLVLDAASSCPTLEACLTTLADWSKRHRDHVPLVVFVEPKDLPTNPNPAIQEVIDAAVADQNLAPWDAAALDRIDALVRDTFGKSLVTPDEVRGKKGTLRAAILDRGWPTLEKIRGGVVVVLNTGGPTRDLYLAGAPSLEGRAMFVPADTDAPYAAVVRRPGHEQVAIGKLVRQHFLVRTRSDEYTVEARANDPTLAESAIASGAQVVTTDFPVADPTISEYSVRLPGDVIARCNPITAPRKCRDADVERGRRAPG